MNGVGKNELWRGGGEYQMLKRGKMGMELPTP